MDLRRTGGVLEFAAAGTGDRRPARLLAVGPVHRQVLDRHCHGLARAAVLYHDVPCRHDRHPADLKEGRGVRWTVYRPGGAIAQSALPQMREVISVTVMLSAIWTFNSFHRVLS